MNKYFLILTILIGVYFFIIDNLLVNKMSFFILVFSLEKTEQNAICSQEKEVGKCRGYFVRYFYNSGAKECQMFIYGGNFFKQKS